MRGRPPINRDLERLRERLKEIEQGLLACYETITIGQQKRAAIEAKIAEIMTVPNDKGPPG